jgi:molecular chaperone GrpE
MSKNKADEQVSEATQAVQPDGATELDHDLSQAVMDSDDTQVAENELSEDTQLLDGEGEPVVGEPEALEAEELVLREEFEALNEELVTARLEAEAMRDQALRVQAEMDNLRKRTERDVENAHKFALEKFAGELLGVRDNLERGMEAAAQEAATVELIREGTELTLKSLTQVLEKFGVVEVNPVGERFDPDRHQAISMQPADGVDSNTVTIVIQKGYTLNDRLIRPAMVVVAK